MDFVEKPMTYEVEVELAVGGFYAPFANYDDAMHFAHAVTKSTHFMKVTVMGEDRKVYYTKTE